MQDGVEAGLVVKDPDNKIYTGFLQWKHVKDSNCRFLDLIQESGVLRSKDICRSLLMFKLTTQLIQILCNCFECISIPGVFVLI